MKQLLSHAATVLPVSDIDQSIDFYTGQLGFELTFSWESPTTYAVLNRDSVVNIHLVRRDPKHVISSIHTAIYIFTHDIESLYTEFLSKGVDIPNPLLERDYGMKDFDVADPDGHILAFGQSVNL